MNFEWYCGDRYFHDENGKIVASVYSIKEEDYLEDTYYKWCAFIDDKKFTLGFYIDKESAQRAVEEYFNTV